jgi:GTP cyclohydrolase I
MTVDKPRIEAAVLELLLAIGEDPLRHGLVTTPARVAESYTEFFAGIGADPLDHLRETLDVDELSDAVVLTDIAFRSICEHHLLPFIGVAHVAYLPRNKVVGLGKLPRVIATLAARPQVQERLTEQIADALETGLEAQGVLVVLDAAHQCVAARGLEQPNTRTITMASRGALAGVAARAELMALIGGPRV